MKDENIFFFFFGCCWFLRDRIILIGTLTDIAVIISATCVEEVHSLKIALEEIHFKTIIHSSEEFFLNEKKKNAKLIELDSKEVR